MRIPRRVAVIAIIVIVIGGCATSPTAPPAPPSGTRQFYVPAVDEVLYRTWVNPGLAARALPTKQVLYPWGLVEQSAQVDGPGSVWKGTSIIVEKQVDANGATWYREYRRGSQAPGLFAYVLDRVSADETILESVSSPTAWPSLSDMDPANPTYVTYQRLETP